jgi:hypothetical protein
MKKIFIISIFISFSVGIFAQEDNSFYSPSVEKKKEKVLDTAFACNKPKENADTVAYFQPTNIQTNEDFAYKQEDSKDKYYYQPTKVQPQQNYYANNQPQYRPQQAVVYKPEQRQVVRYEPQPKPKNQAGTNGSTYRNNVTAYNHVIYADKF